MISLLKQEFDKTVRENPDTRQLLQFFEDGYADLKPKNDLADDPKPDEYPTVGSFILGLLRAILFYFIPAVPYAVTTFCSIVFDAFYVCKNWCSTLKWPKSMAKITDSSLCGGNRLVKGVYQCLPRNDDEDHDEKIKKEFIFVHFNAWECAACLSLLSVYMPGKHLFDLPPHMVAQICSIRCVVGWARARRVREGRREDRLRKDWEVE